MAASGQFKDSDLIKLFHSDIPDGTQCILKMSSNDISITKCWIEQKLGGNNCGNMKI